MADSSRDEDAGENSIRFRKPQGLTPTQAANGDDVETSAKKARDGSQSGTPNGYATTGDTTSAYSSREYAQAFRQWLWQYQWWTQAQMSMYMFPPMYPMNLYPPLGVQAGQLPNGSVAGMLTPNGNVPAGHAVGAGAMPQGPAVQNYGQVQHPIAGGRECKVAALWKRVVAEFIDFFLLFVMKLAASIMVIEYIGLFDMEKYDFDQLLAQDWDSTMALALTSDLIAMEIINRIFICLFETLCLRRGFAGSIGGTTPGKYVMKLRVISCTDVVPLQGGKVLVMPGGEIGFWNAFLRAIIKNFSLVFFFPVCFTVFFFPNNRTAYDIASGGIVVEVTLQDAWAWPHR